MAPVIVRESALSIVCVGYPNAQQTVFRSLTDTKTRKIKSGLLVHPSLSTHMGSTPNNNQDTPDNGSKDIFQACEVNLYGDFELQVENILERVTLSRREAEGLGRLLYDLEQTLRSFWPGCIVIPLGSIVTGLALKTSDMDCHVFVPKHLKIPGDNCVMTAKYVLMKRPGVFQQVTALPAGKVPIVKFYHAPAQRHCDVNFTCLMGLRDTKLVAHLLRMDDRALPLAILLKYWAMVHKLTCHTFPNHAFTMMTIFFLQQADILPSVATLQRNINPDIVENWNVAFNENYQHFTNNNKCLYRLLGGFFEYYSAYKYSENIISPYTGCSLIRNLFWSLDFVPDEFGLYKENVRQRKCNILHINSPMCIQDPFEHDGNSAMAMTPEQFGRFLYHVRHAAFMFRCCSKDEFLRAVLDPRNVPEVPAGTHQHSQK